MITKKKINTLLPVSVSHVASLFSSFALNEKARISTRVFYILWSFKPARISCRDSKSGEMIVLAIPLEGLGDRDLLFPKTFPLQILPVGVF